MFVHLQQYKHEEVQFDDNRTRGQSQTEDTVDKDSAEYFGTNINELDIEIWETVEYEGDPVQRRDITVDGVTAVSVPPTDDDSTDLPGQTIHLRMGGDLETLERAVLLEVQDAEP